MLIIIIIIIIRKQKDNKLQWNADMSLGHTIFNKTDYIILLI